MASKMKFNSSEGQFTETQLSELRSVNSKVSGDSTFILKGIHFMYKSNLEVLAKKSLAGKAKDKEAVSPGKLQILGSMFDERLNAFEIDETEKQSRARRFRQHVHHAIVNINKRKMVDRNLVDKINSTYSETAEDL